MGRLGPLLPGLLVLASLGAQEPAPAYPCFVWPPTAGREQAYLATLVKEARLSPETAAAARKAREAARLPAPPRSPGRRVHLELALKLKAAPEGLSLEVSSRLRGQTLHLALGPAKPEEKVPPLGNERAAEVWGPARGAKPLALPAAAVERSFTLEHARGQAPTPLARHFGDHLVPVLWEHLLPAWVEEMARVVELSGETLVPGKTLIRDRTDYPALGCRSSRVELKIEGGAEGALRLVYKLRVDQTVTRTRDLKQPLPAPWRWLFAVQGEAEWLPGEEAFARVSEKVAARLAEASNRKLLEIADEEFQGTVLLVRQAAEKAGGPGGRKSPAPGPGGR